jgi:hypothetical protein
VDLQLLSRSQMVVDRPERRGKLPRREKTRRFTADSRHLRVPKRLPGSGESIDGAIIGSQLIACWIRFAKPRVGSDSARSW